MNNKIRRNQFPSFFKKFGYVVYWGFGGQKLGFFAIIPKKREHTANTFKIYKIYLKWVLTFWSFYSKIILHDPSKKVGRKRGNNYEKIEVINIIYIV